MIAYRRIRTQVVALLLAAPLLALGAPAARAEPSGAEAQFLAACKASGGSEAGCGCVMTRLQARLAPALFQANARGGPAWFAFLPESAQALPVLQQVMAQCRPGDQLEALAHWR